MSLRPIPLTRALVRALLMLCAVSWLLAASERPGGGSACAAPMATRRYHVTSWTPTFECSTVDGLRLDRQADATPLPEGLEVLSGSVDAGDFAAFKLYVQQEDRRYFAEVTDGFSFQRWFRARTRAVPGSAEVPGRFYVGAQDHNPLVYFGPRNVTREDRVVILDITFGCPFGEWTASYLLTVRGTDSTARHSGARPPTEVPEPVAQPVRSTSIPPAGDDSGCKDVVVTVEAVQAEVSQGSPVEFTVRVTNLGLEPVISPDIRLNPPVGFWRHRWTSSQGFAGYWSPYREEIFSPGTLPAGGSAVATGTGTALFGGELKFSAQAIRATCHPENDAGEARVNVTIPPRPELVGDLERGEVTWTRGGFPLRRLAQGVLRVTNAGQVDAGPTRAMVLLYGDRRPIERVLGWVEVPALPAGASAAVPFSFTFEAQQTRGLLTAILDSDNTEYETGERDNGAVFILR